MGTKVPKSPDCRDAHGHDGADPLDGKDSNRRQRLLCDAGCFGSSRCRSLWIVFDKEAAALAEEGRSEAQNLEAFDAQRRHEYELKRAEVY